MNSQPFSTSTRRTFLMLTVASASLAACSPRHKKSVKHVAVVGGGIIGASVAYHLAKMGVKVTLLERGEIAGRASRGTFAWVNATWAKQPKLYHELNQEGLRGWKSLQSELDIPIRWGGSLEWFPSVERQSVLNEQIAEQVSWGEPAEMLSLNDVQKLEPNVLFGEVESVAFSPNDGALDPVLVTQLLIDAAGRMGADVKQNCAVESVMDNDAGRVTLRTSCGDVTVDKYVLATGADSQATQNLGGLEIPQRTTPGVIVITEPRPRLINRIIVAPGVHIHQRGDGRIVLGEQDGAPDTAAHTARLNGRPTRFPQQIFADQHANRILSIAEQFLPGISESKVEDVVIGWRPLPLDGHPVLGFSPEKPSAYIAIMHSGVSLAPIVGELAAREIVTGQNAEGIRDYRPDRGFAEVRRY